MKTVYPYDGRIRIELELAAPVEGAVRLRVPGWCRSYAVRVNGQDGGERTDSNRYVVLTRRWEDRDVVEATFDMPVERVVAHPAVQADAGRIAVMRGPLVYCFEEVDNPALDPMAPFDLSGPARLVRTGEELRDAVALRWEVPSPVTAIPYHLWDNRTPGWMHTWIHAVPAPVEPLYSNSPNLR
jgi:DUF1680 family protein